MPLEVRKDVVLKRQWFHIYFSCLQNISMMKRITNQRESMQSSINAKTKTLLLTSINQLTSINTINFYISLEMFNLQWSFGQLGCVCNNSYFSLGYLRMSRKNTYNIMYIYVSSSAEFSEDFYLVILTTTPQF